MAKERIYYRNALGQFAKGGKSHKSSHSKTNSTGSVSMQAFKAGGESLGKSVSQKSAKGGSGKGTSTSSVSIKGSFGSLGPISEKGS